MKRRNTILAAVIGIAIVAAAAGGILLMNSGPETADVASEGANDIRPMGPAGTISSAELFSATFDRSNATAFSELRAELDATFNLSEAPDFLMKIAVTNNRDANVTLNGSGFMAVLDNDSTAQALNDRSIAVEPNETAFPVLAFQTNGSGVRSVSYDDGSTSFSVNMTSQGTGGALPDMVTAEAPSGNVSGPDNLTFTSLATWNISANGSSPMPLRFSNGSAVLALMAVTNNNSSSVGLKATDFWLDVGNGTLVRGDARMNNNLPPQLASNTTVPFLIGFRIAENMTANGSAFYWPDQGSTVSEIPLKMEGVTNVTNGLALWSMWSSSGAKGGNVTSGNGTDVASNGTNVTTLNIKLLAIGVNASASSISDVKVWTLKAGATNVTPEAGEDGRTLNITVNLTEGDGATLVQYDAGGETRYVWLRPMVART